MLWRDRLPPARGYTSSDRALDALVVRMHRLALHRGYDRRELGSPLLQRLMPLRRPAGSPAADIADLHRSLKQASLDGNAVAYLIETVETELDLARLRLT